MLILEEISRSLHPTYQNAVQSLEQKWEMLEDPKTKMDLLKEFSNNFLMLPQFWNELIRLSKAINSLEEHQKILKRAHFHFCLVEENSPENGYKKLLHHETDFSFSEEYLEVYQTSDLNKMVHNFEYPNKCLNETFKFYEEYISSPMKKDVLNRFKKSMKLYVEIMASNDNLERWFQNIIQVDDEEFIVNNIEYRLGKDLNNLDFWKMYIGYLKNRNSKKLLTLYSKYCRYFTDDEGMKKEYQKATEKYGPSYVQWKNKFDFETFDTKEKAALIPQVKENNQLKEFSSIFRKGEFQHFQDQNFSLPKTVINYISQHPQIFHKLCQTCKYFFATKPIPVFHNFVCKSLQWKEGVEFYEQSLAVFFPSMKTKFSKNTKIKFNHKFIISNSLNVTYHNNLNILSTSIIPNIFQCFAKFIRLNNQNLSLKEFKFLTQNNTVEMLHLNSIKIFKNDKTLTLMEEILELVPKITVFEIFSPTTSSKTFEALLKLKFVNKIYSFKMFNLKYFEPIQFCDFLKINLDKNAKIVIRFDEMLYRNHEEYQKMKDLRRIFFKEFDENWNKEESPRILYA